MMQARRSTRRRLPRRERPFALRRQELGWSLDQAAVRLRITPAYLRALELGRHPLSISLAERMALLYRTSVHAQVART